MPDTSPTEAERDQALDFLKEHAARTPSEPKRGVLIDLYPTSEDLAQALATARETAQREAEARLVEMREACAQNCDDAAEALVAEHYGEPMGEYLFGTYEELRNRARRLRAIPLPGAERWEKLREAARKALETRTICIELQSALASFGEREERK